MVSIKVTKSFQLPEKSDLSLSEKFLHMLAEKKKVAQRAKVSAKFNSLQNSFEFEGLTSFKAFEVSVPFRSIILKTPNSHLRTLERLNSAN